MRRNIELWINNAQNICKGKLKQFSTYYRNVKASDKNSEEINIDVQNMGTQLWIPIISSKYENRILISTAKICAKCIDNNKNQFAS